MRTRHWAMSAALAGALAMTLAAGGVAMAQPTEGMHGHWGHGEGMEFLHGVTLTDAQKTQIHDIMKSSFATMKPLMEQARTLHEQQVNSFLAAGAVTAESLQPALAKEEALRTQMDTARMNTMLQVRAVLTPEQLAQAASVHSQMEALHAQEHQVMGDPEP